MIKVAWVIRFRDCHDRFYYHTPSGSISYMPHYALRYRNRKDAELRLARSDLWGPDTQIVARVKAVSVPHAETE